jgi:hypothetical protein
MADAAILHRLYTNAAEEGATEAARGRVIDLGDRDASQYAGDDVLKSLDDLLRKTVPASTQTGFAVRRFIAKGGRTYACVVASYPDLVDAADDRAGVLNHARLIEVDAPSFDALALIELAQQFPIADVCAARPMRRLRAYLDELANETSVSVRAVEASALQREPREIVTSVVLACLATHARREHVAMSIADARPVAIARAWAALPLALQRTSSWAAGVKENCPVDVIFSTSHGNAPAQTASDALVSCVKQYVQLLQSAPETVSAMLANPALSDKTAFAAAVQRSAVAPELSSMAGETMSKKERATKAEPRDARAEWQPLDGDVRAELDRQMKAMADVLRREMDDRLATFEAKLRSQSAAAPRQTSLAWTLLPVWVTAAVLVLAALAWFGIGRFLPGASRTQSSVAMPQDYDTARDPAPAPANPAPAVETAAVSPRQAAVARAQTSGAWADEFKNLLERDASFVATTISAVARREEVPREANAALTNFATRIARNEDLQAAGRERLRALLLDCLASDLDGAKIRIDGKLADVAPHVAALKRQYRAGSTSDDPTQMSLQSEILVRWLAELDR